MAITEFTRAPKFATGEGIDVSGALNRYAQLHEKRRAEAKQEKEKNETDYLNYVKELNPEYTESARFQEEQANQIKQLTSKLGEIYQRSNNKPTLKDKVEIQQNLNGFHTWQQSVIKDQQEWESAKKRIDGDKQGLFDKNKFQELSDERKKSNKFMTPSGGYLHYNKIDLGNFTREHLKGPLNVQEKIVDSGGRTHIYKKKASDEDVKQTMHGLVLSNPQYGATAMDEFYNLPSETKAKYLSKYSEQNPQDGANNAITDYIFDKHGKSVVPTEVVDKPTPQRRGSELKVDNSTIGKSEDAVPTKIKVGGVEKQTNIPMFSGPILPKNINIQTSGEEIDLRSNKPNSKTGIQTFNNVQIKYGWYNEKEKRMATEEEVNSGLGTGWKKRALLIGKEVGLTSTSNKSKLATQSDLDQINRQTKGELGKLPLTLDDKPEKTTKSSKFDKYKRK